MELHIRPYGEVFKTSAGDVLKTWYTILENFFMLERIWYHDDVMVQSQDPDVRLIFQINIIMCFVYNMSAISWQYRG